MLGERNPLSVAADVGYGISVDHSVGFALPGSTLRIDADDDCRVMVEDPVARLVYELLEPARCNIRWKRYVLPFRWLKGRIAQLPQQEAPLVRHRFLNLLFRSADTAVAGRIVHVK